MFRRKPKIEISSPTNLALLGEKRRLLEEKSKQLIALGSKRDVAKTAWETANRECNYTYMVEVPGSDSDPAVIQRNISGLQEEIRILENEIRQLEGKGEIKAPTVVPNVAAVAPTRASTVMPIGGVLSPAESQLVSSPMDPQLLSESSKLRAMVEEMRQLLDNKANPGIGVNTSDIDNRIAILKGQMAALTAGVVGQKTQGNRAPISAKRLIGTSRIITPEQKTLYELETELQKKSKELETLRRQVHAAKGQKVEAVGKISKQALQRNVVGCVDQITLLRTRPLEERIEELKEEIARLKATTNAQQAVSESLATPSAFQTVAPSAVGTVPEPNMQVQAVALGDTYNTIDASIKGLREEIAALKSTTASESSATSSPSQEVAPSAVAAAPEPHTEIYQQAAGESSATPSAGAGELDRALDGLEKWKEIKRGYDDIMLGVNAGAIKPSAYPRLLERLESTLTPANAASTIAEHIEEFDRIVISLLPDDIDIPPPPLPPQQAQQAAPSAASLGASMTQGVLGGNNGNNGASHQLPPKNTDGSSNHL